MLYFSITYFGFVCMYHIFYTKTNNSIPLNGPSCPHLVSTWQGWPWHGPGPPHPAGSWSWVPGCVRQPASVVGTPVSALSLSSAGPISFYWSTSLNPCSAASLCLRSETAQKQIQNRSEYGHFTKRYLWNVLITGMWVDKWCWLMAAVRYAEGIVMGIWHLTGQKI